MTTIEKSRLGALSKEDLQEGVKREKVRHEATVELNDLARSVAEQFAQGTVSPQLVSGTVALIEFLGMMAICSILLMATDGAHSLLSFSGTLGAVTVAALTVVFSKALDAYQIPVLRSFTNSASRAMAALVLALAADSLIILGLSGTQGIPGNWLMAVFVTGTLFQLGTRAIMNQYVGDLANSGRLVRRAVIVGGGEPAAELIRSLEANPESDIRVCGVFDDRTDGRSPDIVAGYPRLGTISELLSFARKARIDMMIVSLPVTAEKRVLQLMKRLWILPVDIRLSAHTNKMSFRPRSYSYEGTVPMVDVVKRPIAEWDGLTKRAFDVIGAAIAIVLLSPVMIAAAIAVRLDSEGPVIFKQKREGFNNEEIEIYKFRSLHTQQGDASGINVVTKGDSRVTKVGRFIRKTSIDELPQLFNVLQGRLSLVGPRPHVPNAQTNNQQWVDVVDSYIARHKVKPGVTGWAQITGWRGEVDNEEKLKGRINADLYYIENWSLMFDLYILLITPLKLLNTENAY